MFFHDKTRSLNKDYPKCDTNAIEKVWLCRKVRGGAAGGGGDRANLHVLTPSGLSLTKSRKPKP